MKTIFWMVALILTASVLNLARARTGNGQERCRNQARAQPITSRA